jgi:hypothetical protein
MLSKLVLLGLLVGMVNMNVLAWDMRQRQRVMETMAAQITRVLVMEAMQNTHVMEHLSNLRLPLSYPAATLVVPQAPGGVTP